jgi:cytidylate kinase
MCGSGGRTVASKLAEYLEPHAPYGRHWTIFDHDLIKMVLEDHALPARLAEFLPESSRPRLREMMETLRGKQPFASKIVEQTVETIWHLAAGGHVILVGRAANVITASLQNVFHVRLVGSLENRTERVEEVYDFDRRAAVDYIKAQDTAKRHYLKQYFGEDIDDAQLYHLVINTDRIPYSETAKLIANAVLHWFNLPSAAIPK